jgi:molybdopterin synthase sulfur carrier subunit
LQVEVRIFATLRRYHPDLPVGGVLHMEVESGTSLADLRDQLGLPPVETMLVMVNNLQASFDDDVRDGDRIAFIPAVAGG